ncbi:hypothetical protein GBAR_LOCUS15974 [Geodia barretti]|uniref:Uncharacterized protein n=1 Tax=Geodia barretti TaxID=519541 RepID=A0AA35SFN9_GEOBA|nr:hypothetical protein GBAR_LOCUS15974 [Geodia barretti]
MSSYLHSPLSRNLTRPNGHMNSLSGLGSRIGHRIDPLNFRGVNDNALRSLVHLSINPVFFSAMSRPEIWILLLPKLSLICSLSCTV